MYDAWESYQGIDRNKIKRSIYYFLSIIKFAKFLFLKAPARVFFVFSGYTV